MSIFKLITKKNWHKRNYILLKEIKNLDVKCPPISYKLPKLTKEEIDDIHLRGKITAAEMVEECEWAHLCISEAIELGSSSKRCKEFQHNCHECLVDFVKDSKEYYSIYEVTNPFKIDDDLEDSYQKVKKI